MYVYRYHVFNLFVFFKCRLTTLTEELTAEKSKYLQVSWFRSCILHPYLSICFKTNLSKFCILSWLYVIIIVKYSYKSELMQLQAGRVGRKAKLMLDTLVGVM